MKNVLYKGVLIIAILVFISSCNKVLNRTPQDAITDLNFWQTTDELKIYCNNFYPSLYVPDPSADVQSDNCVPNSPNNWLFNLAIVPSSGGGWSSGDWSNIRNANYFLSHYQQVNGVQADIDQYVGEIHFFRAWEYFNKVKTFGDVPWINKDLNINDTNFLFMPRTPRKVIVDSIITDLEYAASHLKAPQDLELGRINKFAALQLLARVALYEGTWMKYRNIDGWNPYLDQAVAASKDIMDNGGFDILAPDAQYYYKKGDIVDGKTNTIAGMDYPLHYREQFIQEDLSDNKESVLAKIYIPDVLMHGLSRSVNESGIGVSKDFIDDFLCVDGDPIALSPLYKGDDSVVLELQNRDPRLRNMIDNRFLPNYLNGTNPVSNFLTPISSSVPTGYMASKFRSPIPAENEANHTTYDLYVFRYAEVLLTYAEAKAELGGLTQGDIDISINKLRARLDDPSLPDGKMARLSINPLSDPNAYTILGKPRYGYDVSPIIYEIRRERRIELAFEGFRWDDIVRWNAGKLIENPKTVYGIVVNNDVRQEYDEYFQSDAFAGVNIVSVTDWDGAKQLVAPYNLPNRKWDDRLYLHPLPTDQITLSKGSLNQNSGW